MNETPVINNPGQPNVGTNVGYNPYTFAPNSVDPLLQNPGQAPIQQISAVDYGKQTMQNVGNNVEGGFDKVIKGIISFIAKLAGQPDPFTKPVNNPNQVPVAQNIPQQLQTPQYIPQPQQIQPQQVQVQPQQMQPQYVPQQVVPQVEVPVQNNQYVPQIQPQQVVSQVVPQVTPSVQQVVPEVQVASIPTPNVQTSQPSTTPPVV